jgi:hypothetical protein
VRGHGGHGREGFFGGHFDWGGGPPGARTRSTEKLFFSNTNAKAFFESRTPGDAPTLVS